MTHIFDLLFVKNTIWVLDMHFGHEVFSSRQGVNFDSPKEHFDPFWGIQLPQFYPVNAIGKGS